MCSKTNRAKYKIPPWEKHGSDIRKENFIKNYSNSISEKMTRFAIKGKSSDTQIGDYTYAMGLIIANYDYSKREDFQKEFGTKALEIREAKNDAYIHKTFLNWSTLRSNYQILTNAGSAQILKALDTIK